MGRGNDYYSDDELEEELDTSEADAYMMDESLGEQCNTVRHIPFESFRQRLVTHFDIAFQKGEVRWPERNKGR